MRLIGLLLDVVDKALYSWWVLFLEVTGKRIGFLSRRSTINLGGSVWFPIRPSIFINSFYSFMITEVKHGKQTLAVTTRITAPHMPYSSKDLELSQLSDRKWCMILETRLIIMAGNLEWIKLSWSKEKSMTSTDQRILNRTDPLNQKEREHALNKSKSPSSSLKQAKEPSLRSHDILFHIGFWKKR